MLEAPHVIDTRKQLLAASVGDGVLPSSVHLRLDHRASAPPLLLPPGSPPVPRPWPWSVTLAAPGYGIGPPGPPETVPLKGTFAAMTE